MSDSAALSDAAAACAGGLRVAVNRQIFRGMLLTMGTTALAMDRLGVPRSIILSFAKLQGRNTCRALGVRVAIHGADLVAEGGPYVFTPNHQAHIDIAALLRPGKTPISSGEVCVENPEARDRDEQPKALLQFPGADDTTEPRPRTSDRIYNRPVMSRTIKTRKMIPPIPRPPPGPYA